VHSSPVGLLLVLALAAPANALQPDISWSTESIGTGGTLQPLPLGRLRVPENHGDPAGASITLALVRLPSSNPTPGVPVVFLAGGPGGSGIGEAGLPHMWALFEELRKTADVILLDQRGTGRSEPNLSCPGPGAPPLELFRSEQTMRAHVIGLVERCAATQRARGVRPEFYTSEQSADDIESVRRALGVEQLSLFGFSYGTHLGLATLRRHGERIQRVVLAGVEGPDHNEKLPSVMDVQLERLALYAREDPTIGKLASDLVGTLRALLERLEREPARVPSTDDPKSPELLIGRAGLQYLLFRDLGDTNDWPVLPGLIMTAANGGYGLLGQFARRRWNQLRATSLMAVAVDCASGSSPERHEQVMRESRAALLGNQMNFYTEEICRAGGAAELGPAFRARIFSTVPTLFISGTLDSQTPPHQAEEVRWGFPRGVHVVVGNAGHESTLDKAEVRRIVAAFLAGAAIAEQRIELPRPAFRGPRQ
jgi:pimeloyl-ACP methyl ester carboxylesterase